MKLSYLRQLVTKLKKMYGDVHYFTVCLHDVCFIRVKKQMKSNYFGLQDCHVYCIYSAFVHKCKLWAT
jgi:hypothetical protein